MSSKEPDARIRIDKMLFEAGWKLPGWAKEVINFTAEINNNSGEAEYVLLSSKENHFCRVEAKKLYFLHFLEKNRQEVISHL
tara:strand:- start:1715 stop:1960 length:246 start_codon:yes stop_codon:yes gene_type:complete